MIDELAEAIARRIAPRVMCEHLSPEDVAKLLNVSDKHVRNLIATGELEAVNIGTTKKLWRVSAEHLERFRAARSNKVA